MDQGYPAEPLTFRLNGRTTAIDPSATTTTLLEFIRAQGLTGAKEGCAEGECGACTVAVVAPNNGASEYRPINSCLVLLPAIAGHEVYTVEALAGTGELADVQHAMAAGGGSQCGYCTPGFVVSLFAEQYRPARTGPCDLAALSGNLCRCTGYRPIADLARTIGPAPAGPFRDRLQHGAPSLHDFEGGQSARPRSLARALECLAAHPDAAVVAGGTDLGVDVNLKGRQFEYLVVVDALEELRGFRRTPDRLVIGAGLPLADIGRLWADAPAAVREWLELFASPLIRNRATLGGNLATASPIGDAAPLLLALDARVVTASASGTRTRPLSSFFTGYRRTALSGGELIVAIDIPLPLPGILSFYKVTKRRLDDISTVAAAMALTLDGGRISDARFAFGGVAATPIRVAAAEQAVVGGPWNEAAADRVRSIIESTLQPLSDQRGSKEYRLAVTSSLVEHFWSQTRGRP
jgi:xanthine dehydrogenase small subunit